MSKMQPRPKKQGTVVCFWRGVVLEQDGATTFEWTLLLAAIVLPSYFIMRLALETLIAHYGMVTTLNGLPFP
jgi:hypothetical protein